MADHANHKKPASPALPHCVPVLGVPYSAHAEANNEAIPR
jgi:hypothetical protein